MNKVKFFVDACAVDLNPALVSQYDINLLYPQITFNDKDYPSDCTWVKTPREEYLSYLHQGNFATVSQVSLGEWKDSFEEALEEGYDVLFLSLSQQFSGGYKNASMAKTLLLKNYPDREFEIIDSGLASAGYKLYALKIAEELRGLTLESLSAFSEYVQNKYSKRIQVYWVCPNLKYIAFMSRGSDSFDASNVPQGSPLLATDFEGSFSTISLNSDTEEAFQDLLQKLDGVKSWEFSYSPDLTREFIDAKMKVLADKLNIGPEHIASWMSPTNIAIAGPYSYSIGVLR